MFVDKMGMRIYTLILYGEIALKALILYICHIIVLIMKNQSKHDNNQIDGSTAKCFEHLQPEEQAFLNDKKTRLSYSAGENIFKQGAFAPHVIYISEGLVKVYLQVGYDKFINVRLANAGEFIAFSTIFYENVYNYSAVAIKD